MSIGILICLATNARAADVSFCSLKRFQCWIQTNDTPTTAIFPFGVEARVAPTTNGVVTSVTVACPGKWSDNLAGFVRETLSQFQIKLDSYWPATNYTFEISTRNEGTIVVDLALPSGAYPNTPRIRNLPALQGLDPSSNIFFYWDSFIDGTTNDLIQFELTTKTAKIFNTGQFPGAPGALDGTATGIRVPANTLQPRCCYVGKLSFARVLSRPESTIPGFSAYAQETFFYVTTLGAVPPMLVSVTPPLGATNVPCNMNMTFTFNKPMNNSGYSWMAEGGLPFPATTWSADRKSLIISHSALAGNASCAVCISPGIGWMSDVDGNPLLSYAFGTRFSTGTNLLRTEPLPPSLQMVAIPPTGAAQLRLAGGEPFRSYELEASGDLAHWETVATLFATNVPAPLADPSPSRTNRFYRVHTLP